MLFRESHTHDGLTFRQERVVRDYIHEHLGENITLDDLASSVAFSRYHFARRFRVSTGTTPHEYVLQQRVARAQALLTRTSYPLLDMAVTCGFADQSHFNRAFKKHTGVPPDHYRKHSRPRIAVRCDHRQRRHPTTSCVSDLVGGDELALAGESQNPSAYR